MTVGSNSLWDFLQCMDLIRVAWKKLNACLSSNMWEKKAFQLSLVLIDCLPKSQTSYNYGSPLVTLAWKLCRTMFQFTASLWWKEC